MQRRSIRPRRSVLFMPGSNDRAMEKSKSLPADCLVMDLEDAVVPDRKEEIRDIVCAKVKAGGYGNRELVIRVNGRDTQWYEAEVAAVAKSGADALLLPKVESADEIIDADNRLKAAGAPDHMSIWCMIETPFGVLRAQDILAASSRIEVILIGLADLSKNLRCVHTSTREPFIWAMQYCVMTARAYGIDVIDGIHPDIEDDEGFAVASRHGKDLGFDGKTIIHPRTLEMANNIFSPSKQEIEWSQRIIGALEEAVAQGHGLTSVDGRIVENLHVERARQILDMVEQIVKLTPGSSEN